MHRILPIDREIALFDTAQTRAIEQREAGLLPPHTLMQRAGESVARLAMALAPHARSVWVAAGPGNNGGDGLEASVHLLRWGKQVRVSLFGDLSLLPGDAREAFARARAAGVPIDGAFGTPSEPPHLAIDALLGIGANRAPQGPLSDGVRALNTLACPVVAVDLPSGLNANTGQPLGDDCVVATHTLTLLTLKPGLLTASGRDHVGELWLDVLGVDAPGIAPRAWLSGHLPDGARSLRRHAQHKGSFGDVAVVGGAPGMTGAALLAARAAHAAGAGRVYVELLDPHAGVAASDPIRPELMFRHAWSSGTHAVLAQATIVCGCGGADAIRKPLPRLLSVAKRLVLDADALNAIATDPALEVLVRARAARGHVTILTPHPLEAARLLGSSTHEVQSDRLGAAIELSVRFGCVVILKGSGTVTSAPGQTPRINSTGNAALATAGSGDVLAGWLAGRWAQIGSVADPMATAFQVACSAVAAHGAAADPQPAGPLRAADLIERMHASAG